MKPEMRSRVWLEMRPFVGPAIIVMIYLIVRAIYAATSHSQGLFTPSGSLDAMRAALAVATLGMRMLVLVVILWVVVYRIVMRLLRRWT